MAWWVRRLRKSEAPLVQKLRIQEEATPYFSPQFWEEFGEGGEDWGLWLDGGLIGWCRVVGRPPVLWVSRILIDSPYVGLGYGKVLLERVLEEKRRLLAWREVRAAVHPANERALRFFERMGFMALPFAAEVGEVILRKDLG